ncbi:CD59 glycoprotein [Nematostella vectensis]|uniref:CD59 glycoprotein n=1 Tax=Nematostella vectensis TaxID=45351 RepID=UPI00138FAB59|nr:CD59 glycoprotein [Nematostella vectensis]
MNSASFSLLAVVLAVVIPSACAIECYVCSDQTANCQTKEVDCSKAGPSWKYCMKYKEGKTVVKTCATKSLCDKGERTCKGTDKCISLCCDNKDLCNNGFATSPMLMSLLVPTLLLVLYL